ncbi:hypothetical protein R2F61_03950 [Mollicutes bacterium LVI A0078]|nr:hypothetical protein RZE84_03970 [Mollicutes bacterium LVI A0075]WOO91716.1 hypothetical protein R2F61_03950 [Mollicutes bacterium LVI A0078]
MKIIHDEEKYDNLVSILKETHDNITDLRPIIAEISETLYSFNMESASGIVGDAIDELEEKLGDDFLSELEELITAMSGANESMLDLDDKMKSEIGG